MIIDSIAKALIASSIVLCFGSVQAWSVSDPVVDGLLDKQTDQPATQSFDLNIAPTKDADSKVLALPPQHIQNKNTQFEKRASILTPDEEASADFRKALQYRENGETFQAERLLKDVLVQMPTYHAARSELATILLKRNQLDETEMFLSEGLRLDENNPDFLRLMAMVYDKREDPEKALALLVKVKDSRKQDQNYVAFLGHIYQQMGKFALARQQYYRLLQAEPDNPLWLLGVSIALDAEGQKEAALEGYRKLTTDGNMDPHVLQYVQDRIKLLKG